ncbi:MAG: methyltransferase domain-containing protein [Spirochaetes bacterium]|nr:methyltransferase domain-containing protein [Spirochaetota bacterium]
MEASSWESHYTAGKSALLYPDENLVRLLRKNPLLESPAGLTAVDLGCGSGRHLRLLADLGIPEAIGIDTSYNALVLSGKQAPGALIQGDNQRLPLKNECADIVIAWGSLHYNNKYHFMGMLEEILRILKSGGYLFATLRSERDTYLKRGKHLGNNVWITDLSDISGSTASFYGEGELQVAFSIFSAHTYGLMERTLMGDITSLISHWVIEARK